jgi:hypothetical protein
MSGPSDDKTQLIAAVRGWIHMDNLTESFNRQASNARTLRDKHEADAMELMKKMGLGASTIQVSGATLQMTKKKSPGSLSWTWLNRETAAWAHSAGLSEKQSQGLSKWLQDHREVKEVEFLKKTTVPVQPLS